MTNRTFAFICLIIISLSPFRTDGQTLSFQSEIKTVHPKISEINCLPLYNHVIFWQKKGKYRDLRTAFRKISYPLFDWPLTNKIHDGLILINYVDDDNSSAIVDYMGNPHSYDGHRGTDMMVYNFRSMDRGMKIIAAEGGTVMEIIFSNPDRNTKPPYPDFGNWVIVQHSDGTYAWYIHFRKNSITVEEGETIEKGELLGLVGSSGNSTDAHLHFEVGEYIDGVWQKRDPWHGSFNTLPSLWQVQEPYVGDDPIRIYDMGVATKASAGGDETDISFDLFKERLTQPEVFSKEEEFIIVWLQVQGQQSDFFEIEVRRPDESIFNQAGHSLTGKNQRAWYFIAWDFVDNVSASDFGIWQARIKVDQDPVKQINFEVGEHTKYRPRFWPIAGKSFRMNGSIQKDTLRISSLGDEVTYSLMNEPDFVTLQQDSIVTISAESTQPIRSIYFQALATDQSGLQDTMWYHIVDPSKPRVNPVPVELAKFTVEVKNDIVEIYWVTSTEINNYGFVIERKNEKNNWNEVGFVKGNGTTSLKHEYTFLDQNLVPGNLYTYRLKQVDNNGSFKYSQEIQIDYSPVRFMLYQNYPNPFNPKTTIRYQISQEVNVRLQIFDLSGKRVDILKNEKQQPGIYSIEWDATEFSSGLYFIRLDTGDFTEMKKGLLLK